MPHAMELVAVMKNKLSAPVLLFSLLLDRYSSLSYAVNSCQWMQFCPGHKTRTLPNVMALEVHTCAM